MMDSPVVEDTAEAEAEGDSGTDSDGVLDPDTDWE